MSKLMTRFEDELLDAKEASLIFNNPVLSYDLLTSFVGKKIGNGAFRDVYENNFDCKYVIKLEHRNTHCNLVEAMMWNEIQHLTGNLAWVKDWFAPVQWVSPNGRVLVMRKTEQKKKKKPEKIPSFLWDVKSDNFGWIGNKYVCHDYGQFYNFMHYPKKFQTIKWDLIG